MLHSLFLTDFSISDYIVIKQQVDITSMQWKNLKHSQT